MAALGLVILVAAVVVGLVGGLANSGSNHMVNNFSLFGADLMVSSGRIFLYGAILGAAAMLGLNLLLAGTGRSVKHRVENRRNLKSERSRNEGLQQERDALEAELEARREVDVTDGATVNNEQSTSRFR